MEPNPERALTVAVYKAPDDVLDVIMWTIDGQQLDRLLDYNRLPSRRAH